MNSELIFSARRDAVFGPEISLWVYARTSEGLPAVPASPLTMRVLTREESNSGEFRPPFMRLTAEAAQRLVDELWLCGVRPSEGSGSAGSLAATERHLNDMRAIVANSLGVEMPKK
jgi:hypothetical protein